MSVPTTNISLPGEPCPFWPILVETGKSGGHSFEQKVVFRHCREPLEEILQQLADFLCKAGGHLKSTTLHLYLKDDGFVKSSASIQSPKMPLEGLDTHIPLPFFFARR